MTTPTKAFIKHYISNIWSLIDKQPETLIFNRIIVSIQYDVHMLNCICLRSAYIIIMSHKNLKLNNTGNQHEVIQQSGSSRKIRQVYIVPMKDIKPQFIKQSNHFMTTSYRMYTTQFNKKAESLPPKATIFKRNRQKSKDQNYNDQSEFQNGRAEASIEVFGSSKGKNLSLERKLQQQANQKQQLMQKNISYELKIKTLEEEISKLRLQKRQLQKQMLNVQKQFEDNKNNLSKAHGQIQQLNKNLKQNKINLKSLTNLKNIQSQLDYLQQRNKKLSTENQSLQKLVRKKKTQFNKQSTSESQTYNKDYVHDCVEKVQNVKEEDNKKNNRIVKGEEYKHSSREKWLESNLYQLQKKLYEKENEINKLKIQLNCIDRKRTLSIDQVKQKKDQEIKDLRQKFIKISKDLKQAKDKMQKNEKSQRKKSIKQKHNMFFKKVSSSKHIGLTSQSQEVTFQLSSEV